MKRSTLHIALITASVLVSIIALVLLLNGHSFELIQHRDSISFPAGTKKISSDTRLDMGGSSGLYFVAIFELETNQPAEVEKHVAEFCQTHTQDDTLGYDYEFAYKGDRQADGSQRVLVRVTKSRVGEWWE